MQGCIACRYDCKASPPHVCECVLQQSLHMSLRACMQSVTSTPAVSAGSTGSGSAPASLAPSSCLATGGAGPGSEESENPTGFGLGAARSAPWGTVCLAVLVQRASDKAASVRAKVCPSACNPHSHTKTCLYGPWVTPVYNELGSPCIAWHGMTGCRYTLLCMQGSHLHAHAGASEPGDRSWRMG